MAPVTEDYEIKRLVAGVFSFGENVVVAVGKSRSGILPLVVGVKRRGRRFYFTASTRRHPRRRLFRFVAGDGDATVFSCVRWCSGFCGLR